MLLVDSCVAKRVNISPSLVPYQNDEVLSAVILDLMCSPLRGIVDERKAKKEEETEVICRSKGLSERCAVSLLVLMSFDRKETHGFGTNDAQMTIERTDQMPPGVQLRIECGIVSVESLAEVLIDKPADRSRNQQTSVEYDQIEDLRSSILALTRQKDQAKNPADDHQSEMSLKDQDKRLERMNVGPQKSVEEREENSESVTPVEQWIHVKEKIPPDDH